MTGTDGLVAAILDDGIIITSPNQDFVPQPPCVNAEVQLRSDLRYGVDDFTLWPQVFLEKYPHIAGIPRKPSQPTSDLAAMWWTPTITHFSQSTSVAVQGVGVLTGCHMESLRSLKEKLLAEVRLYLEDADKKPLIIESCFSVMVHTWIRLQNNPAAFEEKCMEVTEFQRSWLELRAALTWYTEVHRRILVNIDAPGTVLDSIGAFTTSALVAQELFAAGVPVWLLRPEGIVVEVRIDKVVDLTLPTSLQLGDRDGQSYPVIYRGPCGHHSRYESMHRYTRSRMVWANVWGEEVGEVENRMKMAGPSFVASTTRSLAEIQAQPTLVVPYSGK